MEYFAVLKKYAVFDGRATRNEFLGFYPTNMGVILIFLFLGDLSTVFDIVTAIYILAVFLPSLGVSIRRLHDINKKGYYILLPLIPIVGLIIEYVLLVRKSQSEDNIYGKYTDVKTNKLTYISMVFGALSTIILEIVIVATVLIISFNIMQKNVIQKNNSDISETFYMGSSRSEYSLFTDIGSINTTTKDDDPYNIVVDLVIGYNSNDTAVSTELTEKLFQLKNFIRNFFHSKYVIELQPEKEQDLKKELLELLNSTFLENGEIQIILFNKFDCANGE